MSADAYIPGGVTIGNFDKSNATPGVAITNGFGLISVYNNNGSGVLTLNQSYILEPSTAILSGDLNGEQF